MRDGTPGWGAEPCGAGVLPATVGAGMKYRQNTSLKKWLFLQKKIFLIVFLAVAQKLIISIIIIFSLLHCVAGGPSAKPVPGNDVEPQAPRAARGAGAILPCHVPGQAGSPARVLAACARAWHPSHQAPGVGQPVRDPPGG